MKCLLLDYSAFFKTNSNLIYDKKKILICLVTLLKSGVLNVSNCV